MSTDSCNNIIPIGSKNTKLQINVTECGTDTPITITADNSLNIVFYSPDGKREQRDAALETVDGRQYITYVDPENDSVFARAGYWEYAGMIDGVELVVRSHVVVESSSGSTNLHYSQAGIVHARLGASIAAELLAAYQNDADSHIDTALRARIGNEDINGYEIALPLQGDKNIVDADSKTVTISRDDAITRIANDLVIAYYRRDNAENSERLEKAERDLEEYLDKRFGHVSDVSLDFARVSPGV